MFIHLLICFIFKLSSAELSKDVEYLNELPLNKLLKLKSSLQDLVTGHENITVASPNIKRFGAEALAIQAPPIKRGDYEDSVYKKGESKISNIFSMSVTTLAFLAFGGYLLCLIVHAIRAKQNYINNMPPTTQPTSFFVSAGIKKRPQAQLTSYGRRRRENRIRRSLKMVDVPPEQLFSALLHVCEGYAKWSDNRPSGVY